MTERNPPVWMQSGTYSAEDDRLVSSLLMDRRMTASGGFVGIDGGVVPPKNQLQLAPVGGNSMDFTISSGMAVIPVAEQDPPGVYLCYNEGSFSGSITPASTNPRIDLVIAKAFDSLVVGGTSHWEIQVIVGTAGPNPTTPAVPSGAIAIASVRAIPAAQNGGVNKITTGQISDLRQFVAAPGGMHLTWSTNPNPPHSPGRLLYDATNKSTYVSDGSKWSVMYTYDEWLNYFSAYRPQQVILGGYVYTSSDDWISRPTMDGVVIPAEIQIPKVTTPTGIIKVSLLSFGSISQDNASAHFGILINRQSSGAHVFGPEITRAIAFYQKSWSHHGGTFMISGLPVNTALTVKMMFRRMGAVSTAHFGQSVLMVEPVV